MLVAFACATALFVSSCALHRPEGFAPDSQAEAFNQRIQVIAIEITNRLRDFDPNDKNIAVTTFVDLDNIDEATSFGRFVAEQVGAELYKLGFKVREIRQRKDIEIIQEKGEFYLSRKSAEIMKASRVDAVVTGTFTIVGEEVVVSSRLIGVESGRVEAVGQMVANISQNDYIRDLLNRNSSRSRPVVKVRSGD